jgi:hypothetical protein
MDARTLTAKPDMPRSEASATAGYLAEQLLHEEALSSRPSTWSAYAIAGAGGVIFWAAVLSFL